MLTGAAAAGTGATAGWTGILAKLGEMARNSTFTDEWDSFTKRLCTILLGTCSIIFLSLLFSIPRVVNTNAAYLSNRATLTFIFGPCVGSCISEIRGQEPQLFLDLAGHTSQH